MLPRQTGKTCTTMLLLTATVWGPRLHKFFSALPTQFSFELVKERLPYQLGSLWMGYRDHIAHASASVGKSVAMIDKFNDLLLAYRKQQPQVRKTYLEDWVKEAMEDASWKSQPGLSPSRR